MELFNEAWYKTKSSTILKFWIKSNSLSENQIELARSYCTNEVATGNDISTDSAVQEHEAQALYDAFQSLAHTAYVENPTSDVLEGVSDVENVGQLLELMNVDVSSEEEISRHDIATNQLQSMYDEHTK